MKYPLILANLNLFASSAFAATIISGTTGNGNFETPNVSSATQLDTTGTAIANWAWFGTDRNTGVYDNEGSQRL